MKQLISIDPNARRGKAPCGECHIRPGETCDICGATNTPEEPPGGWKRNKLRYRLAWLWELIEAVLVIAAIVGIVIGAFYAGEHWR